MPSPSLTFSIMLATLFGALTHLILGGSGRQLLVYLLASWLGFAIGQMIGQVMGIRLLAIGPTNVFSASMGSLIAVGTTALLAHRRAVRGR